jgi:hypothetical protein
MSSSNIIASIGVSLLLLAFVLNLRKFIGIESNWHSLLNISGALLCCYSVWIIRFYPFVVLEAIWAMVAFISLLKRVPRGTIIK